MSPYVTFRVPAPYLWRCASSEVVFEICFSFVLYSACRVYENVCFMLSAVCGVFAYATEAINSMFATGVMCKLWYSCGASLAAATTTVNAEYAWHNIFGMQSTILVNSIAPSLPTHTHTHKDKHNRISQVNQINCFRIYQRIWPYNGEVGI